MAFVALTGCQIILKDGDVLSVTKATAVGWATIHPGGNTYFLVDRDIEIANVFTADAVNAGDYLSFWSGGAEIGRVYGGTMIVYSEESRTAIKISAGSTLTMYWTSA